MNTLLSNSASLTAARLSGVSLSLLETQSSNAAIAILLSVLLIATVTDLRQRRIPNWLTLSTAIGAMTLHGIIGGGYALASSVLSFFIWFGLGFAFYQTGARKGIGAGDIKLIMACGALIGFWPCLNMTFVSFLFQVLYMAVRWVQGGRAVENLKRVYWWLTLMPTSRGFAGHFHASGPADKSPHAPFLLAGSVTVLLLWRYGWLVLNF